MKKISVFWGMLFALMLFLVLGSNFACYANKDAPTARENQYFIYENNKLGFTLKIPVSWNGHYMIDTSDANYIQVSFIGQSKTSKWGDPEWADFQEVTGLTLFCIGNQASIKDNEPIADIKKIGVAHGNNLYYFTSLDCPTNILIDVHSDSAGKYDKEEKDLAWDDWLYAVEMEEDVEGIIKSLKAAAVLSGETKTGQGE